jgi:hypothetical protein
MEPYSTANGRRLVQIGKLFCQYLSNPSLRSDVQITLRSPLKKASGSGVQGRYAKLGTKSSQSNSNSAQVLARLS